MAQVARTALGLLAAVQTTPPSVASRAPPLSGHLRIAGSRALAEPVARWVAAFRREHPSVHVSVALYGTGTAAAVMSGALADVAPLTRPLNRDERMLFAGRATPPRALTLPGNATLYLTRAGGAEPTPAALEFARIARRRSVLLQHFVS